MTLQDYTTDELRAELKRRATEARKAANVSRDRKAKYLYAEGTVINVYGSNCGYKRPFSEWRFMVLLDDKYIIAYNIPSYQRSGRDYRVNRAKFNKTTAPKEGDRVRLKCRVTKDSPRWNMFHQPMIDEIIAQAEIVKEVEE